MMKEARKNEEQSLPTMVGPVPTVSVALWTKGMLIKLPTGNDLMSIILMIAMRAIDLELEAVIMTTYNRVQGMKLEMKGIMHKLLQATLAEFPSHKNRLQRPGILSRTAAKTGGIPCQNTNTPCTTEVITSSLPAYNRCKLKEKHGKELSIGYEDTSIILSLNPFLLCHEFSFKELKLFLKLYASYGALVGNLMVNLFTCELALDVDHMLKCSSSCVYLEKQLFVGITRIIPSHHDPELLYGNLFFDFLVANFSFSCASM
ncbi:hypothetical protein M9H77_18119 [Catharanthus roseus]|uniref:Uncharacterized protein n=1 Tax=Catharanthus roseus TaxID=4058 RepID=A0ACC0B6I1_CATRO|nr:hypothetical protein M9H77_18119 [Catharanthus roseus]